MPKIVCPDCGFENSENAAVCGKCGRDLSTVDSGADNIDRIYKTVVGDTDEKLPSVKKAKLNEDLSKEQFDELRLGGAIEFVADDDKPKEPDEAAKDAIAEKEDSVAEPSNVNDISELSEEDLISNELAADILAQADSYTSKEIDEEPEKTATLGDIDIDGRFIEQAEELKAYDNDSAEDEEPAQEEMVVVEKQPGVAVRGVIGAAAAAAVFIFGIIAAVCFIINMFSGEYQDTAFNAMKHVEENYAANKEMTVLDAYVKTTATNYQCVLFCAFREGKSDMSTTSFRVLISREDSSVRVYDEFNETEYLKLKAGTSADKVKASVMRNYADIFDRAKAEIEEGNAGWVRVNENILNLRLDWEQMLGGDGEQSTISATSVAAVSTAAVTTDAPASDVTQSTENDDEDLEDVI